MRKQLEIFLMCHKVGPIVPVLLPYIPYLDVGQMENLHRKIIFSTFCNTNRGAGQTNEPSPKLLNSENFYNFEWVFQIFYLVIWLLLLRTNIIPWLRTCQHSHSTFTTVTKVTIFSHVQRSQFQVTNLITGHNRS